MSVITELFDIYEQNGDVLRPEDVLEFAKDPKTALHKRFTWDDTEAAHQWRLQEARQLIEVTVYLEPHKPRTVRALVQTADPATDAAEYRHRDEVLVDAERRRRLVTQAIAEAKKWRARYNAVEELAPIFAAIDDVDQEILVIPVDAATA